MKTYNKILVIWIGVSLGVILYALIFVRDEEPVFGIYENGDITANSITLDDTTTSIYGNITFIVPESRARAILDTLNTITIYDPSVIVIYDTLEWRKQ